MQTQLIWQQNGSDAGNAENFAAIRDWWNSLSGQEIRWQQRLIPETGTVADLDWEPQRFDEAFAIDSPEIRGITLYWHKPGVKEERNTTPHRLELNQLQQQLYIYPQSQRGIVIRVALPQLVYQKVNLAQPQLIVTQSGNQKLLIVRDEAQRLEIQISLSSENIAALQQLSS